MFQNLQYNNLIPMLGLMVITIIFGAVVGILIFNSAAEFAKRRIQARDEELKIPASSLESDSSPDLNKYIEQEKSLALEYQLKADSCSGMLGNESYIQKCEKMSAHHKQIVKWLEELRNYKSPAFECDFKIRILDAYLLRAISAITETNTHRDAPPVVTSMELPRLVNLLRIIAEEIKYE